MSTAPESGRGRPEEETLQRFQARLSHLGAPGLRAEVDPREIADAYVRSRLREDPALDSLGGYNDATDTITCRTPELLGDGYAVTLLHEVAHAARQREGALTGYHTDLARRSYEEVVAEAAGAMVGRDLGYMPSEETAVYLGQFARHLSDEQLERALDDAVRTREQMWEQHREWERHPERRFALDLGRTDRLALLDQRQADLDTLSGSLHGAEQRHEQATLHLAEVRPVAEAALGRVWSDPAAVLSAMSRVPDERKGAWIVAVASRPESAGELKREKEPGLLGSLRAPTDRRAREAVPAALHALHLVREAEARVDQTRGQTEAVHEAALARLPPDQDDRMRMQRYADEIEPERFRHWVRSVVDHYRDSLQAIRGQERQRTPSGEELGERWAALSQEQRLKVRVSRPELHPAIDRLYDAPMRRVAAAGFER